MAELAERAAAAVGSRPVYITLDIDVVDPGFAPGTGTPEPGGVTSRASCCRRCTRCRS